MISHVRIAPARKTSHAVRIAAGGADLLLACDLVVAAGADGAAAIERGVTTRRGQRRLAADRRASSMTATSISRRARWSALRTPSAGSNLDFIDATGVATALLGDASRPILHAGLSPGSRA